MHSAKDQLKIMQSNYRDEDKVLRDQHEQITILEEKSRKLKDLITEKKKAGPSERKPLTEEDIQKVNDNLEKYRERYKEID